MQSVTIGLILGTLANWGNQGAGGLVPGGYAAGVADQYVLSTLGLHWANPDRYAGDWFMEAAPQPHWFFDILTYIGSSVHHLSITYLLFWFVGLLAFGLATTLLVRHWTPRYHWLNAIVFTVVISTTPWTLVGTGTSMISYSIPAAVGGNFVYLFAALLLTRRLRAGAAVASLVAIVHVQEGAVAAVILICVFLSDRVQAKTINWVVVAGIASNVAFVAFGLWLRPVAANPGDFVEICNRIIPYHCAAHTWSSQAIFTASSLIVLALATVFCVRRSERGYWIAVVGLPAVALLVGLVADYFQIPVVGPLAQSINIYRLGALITPFAIFGLLVPLTRNRWGIAGLFGLVGWIPLMVMSLQGRGWQVADSRSPIFLACLGLCMVAVAISQWPPLGMLVRRSLPPLAMAAFAMIFLVSAVLGNKLTVRGLDPVYIPDDSFPWLGAAGGRRCPARSATTGPATGDLRARSDLSWGRCRFRNIPYGGNPWREWNDRIEDLGGWQQCLSPFSPVAYNSLTAHELDQIADKYAIHYLVLEQGQMTAKPGLEKLGWSVILGPQPGVQNYVLSDAKG